MFVRDPFCITGALKNVKFYEGKHKRLAKACADG